eukprot:355539-Chlamydomonas_euryale.AAC.2
MTVVEPCAGEMWAYVRGDGGSGAWLRGVDGHFRESGQGGGVVEQSGYPLTCVDGTPVRKACGVCVGDSLSRVGAVVGVLARADLHT